MTMRDGDVLLRLGDGRALGYRIFGDPRGAPLLFLHGTPGSRLKFSIGDEAGRKLGLAIIAPDRWGYGLTDAPAAPTLSGFASDMGALMDHLGHARFAVGGISGGGPFAAAVAACHARRVPALALISPVGPIADARAEEALSTVHRFCFTVLPGWPKTIAVVFRGFRWSLAHAPRLAGQLATLRGAGSDREIIARPDVAERLLGSFREGLRPGTAGPVTDLHVFSQPWDVNLKSIAAPTRMWIGGDDTAVPIAAARALAETIPHCTLSELPGEGHLWLATHYPLVLEWIASVVCTPSVLR